MNEQLSNQDKIRGDIALYLSLIILLATAAAIVTLSNIAVRQLRASGDIVASEKAIYAADSGTEALFYCLKNNTSPLPDDIPACEMDAVYDLGDPASANWPEDGRTIEYPDGSESVFDGRYLATESAGELQLCSKVQGSYGSVFRFISSLWEGLSDRRCEDEVSVFSS